MPSSFVLVKGRKALLDWIPGADEPGLITLSVSTSTSYLPLSMFRHATSSSAQSVLILELPMQVGWFRDQSSPNLKGVRRAILPPSELPFLSVVIAGMTHRDRLWFPVDFARALSRCVDNGVHAVD